MARKPKVIIGLGETGLSFARYLASTDDELLVMDDAPRSEKIAALHQISEGTEVRAIEAKELLEASEIYLSPGVPLSTPAIVQAREAGIPVKGDVQLFGEIASAPIVSITGSNGKSTVAAMLHHCASGQKSDVRLVGNIGSPCLDQLEGSPSFYVLEVSSYQLELATELNSEVAVVLNLSPDHLDRYDSVDHYYETKLALYNHCVNAVVNRDLGLSLPALQDKKVVTFGSDKPVNENDFGMDTDDGLVLMKGSQKLTSMSELGVDGHHNALNVLAVLAMSELLQLDLGQVLESLKSFEGLAHRGELIAEIDGVRFVNDSKATNPGAMCAAIEGFSNGNNIILIVGGETKGLSFEGLGQRMKPFVKTALLIGHARDVIREGIDDAVPVIECEDLEAAVRLGQMSAEMGDVVLLSPGCASFDEFESYIDRGDSFRRYVGDLVEAHS